MHRQDNSKYLLYIEPSLSEKSETPIIDEWVELLENEIQNGKKGASNYNDPYCKGRIDENLSTRGFHATACGKYSSSQCVLLSNGLITNTLAPYYLKYYRSSISESDWIKIRSLKDSQQFESAWIASELIEVLKEGDWGFMDNEDDSYLGDTAEISESKTDRNPTEEIKGYIKDGFFKIGDVNIFKTKKEDNNDAMAYVCLNGEVVIMTK